MSGGKMLALLSALRGPFDIDEYITSKIHSEHARNWTTGDFVYLAKDPSYWWFVQDDGSAPDNTMGTVYLISEDSQTNIYFPGHCRKWPGPDPTVTPWLQKIIDEYRLQFAQQRDIASRIDSDGPVSQDTGNQ